MEKYAYYKVFYCKDTGEYIQVPHAKVTDTLEKYAELGHSLEEVRDDYEIDNYVRIVNLDDEQ